MKINKNQNQNQEQNSTPDIRIGRVSVFQNGDFNFELIVRGVHIYGCRIVQGKAGPFISFPSRKGDNGKYYSHAYVKLSEDEVALIIKEIEEYE